MQSRSRAPLIVGGMLAVALGVVVAIVGVVIHHRSALVPIEEASSLVPPATKPAPPDTQPAITFRRPDTKPAEPFEATYMDVIRATATTMPTTQPLAVPLDLSQAARLIITDPIYLDRSRGDLWITRSQGRPIEQVLHDAVDPKAVDPQSHVLRERVLYVHWSPTDDGPWVPFVVYQVDSSSTQVATVAGRKSLPSDRDYQWNRAFSWGRDAVVPTSHGVSIVHFGATISETYQPLTQGSARIQTLLDGEGLLAWATWKKDADGSDGAARYVDSKWIPLASANGWPKHLVYLVPLRDGTVFQFVGDEQSAIALQSAKLADAVIDEAAVRQWVAMLGDIDQDHRRKAFTELSTFGPGAWPILQKLLDQQPPQAQSMIRQLLKDKTHPTLSGMTLVGDRTLKLVNFLADGGAVFYAEQGVNLPGSQDPEAVIAPAWLSVRPGHYVELLPESMVTDLSPGTCNFQVVGDQWIVTTDVAAPRLFFGAGLAQLTTEAEKQFTQIIGIDQLGRWLLREPTKNEPTLIIDPHLPDPTPRLPVWQLAVAKSVGWDKDNWPVIENGPAYALNESDWRSLNKDESFVKEMPPATQPAGAESLLKLADGTQYFGGLTDLRVTRPNGQSTTWSLPAIANGEGPATLLRTHDGRLYLYNSPGRLLRIAETPDAIEPFKIEATFTRNIPSARTPTRIWLDPAGRIDFAWDNRLAITFPEGYIPHDILDKIVDRTGLDADGK